MEPETAVDLIPRILHPQKILVPIDFSATSKKAFHYALRFAEQFGCEIILLHVIEPVTAIAGASPAVDTFSDAEEDTIAAEAELACLAASSRNRSSPSRQRCAQDTRRTRSPKPPRSWTSI